MSKVDCSVEMWLAIAEYENYEVSNLGRVRSWWKRGSGAKLGRRKTPVVMKSSKHTCGYRILTLRNNKGEHDTKAIHHLVLMAFSRDRLSDEKHVRHLDGNPENNRIDNLEWGTVKENYNDQITHGTQRIGSKHGMAVLNESSACEVVRLVSQGLSHRETARIMNVHRSTITCVMRGSTWSHVTGIEKKTKT